MTGRRLTDSERARVLQMRASGALVKQIAFTIGCGEKTVRRICRKFGVKKVFSNHPESVKSRRLYSRKRPHLT